MPAPMAAWLAETGSVTRRPGPLARASHGMDAAAQDTANRMLIASTGAGLAARDMDAIAPRAAPVACLPVAAGIVVSIQIMPPAAMWRRRALTARSSRSEPRTSRRKRQPRPILRAAPTPPGRATAAWRETCGGEDRGEHPPGRERRDHHGCWS